MPVNEFFLDASGLTEAEFFQVARSLRPPPYATVVLARRS
jgi:hypothetical protein